MKLYNTLHKDVLAAQELAYEPNGLLCSTIIQEAESHEYGACTFTLNGKLIAFRVAKITPTKSGQFVTFWKRNGGGPIMPYTMNDSFDLLVVSVRSVQNFGQFVFPKEVLGQKELIAKDGKEGKRAMRVYPPWDITTSSQAKATQAWQLLYFFEIQPTLDRTRIQKLFY